MAKAIHWPQEFREIILAEGTEQTYSALRPGTLYYDNQYWVDGEVVDIRVNHLRVRKAQVVGGLSCTTLGAIAPQALASLKPGLRSLEALIHHLQTRYQQPFDANSWVSVVHYRNLPINPDDLEIPDDPHR